MGPRFSLFFFAIAINPAGQKFSMRFLFVIFEHAD